MTLKRYIFFELIKSFLLTFLILTLLVFIITTMLLMRKYGQYLNFLDLVAISPYLLGSTSSLTLPMALLPAITLTYGRMAHEREILVLDTSGHHSIHYLLPAFVFGCVCTVFCLYLNHALVPGTHAKKREITYSAIDLVISATFSQERSSIDLIPNLRVFYDRVEQGRLQKLVIQKINSYQVTEEILAQSGSLVYDKGLHSLAFKLDNGSILRIERNKRITEPGEQQRILFEHINFPIRLQDIHTYNKDRAKYKPSWQVKKDIRHWQEELKKLKTELKNNPDADEQEIQAKIANWQEEILEAEVELFGRWAISFSSLVIVFLGAPLGILVRHGNKLVAFGVSAVPIILLYYPLMMGGETLAEDGVISPFLGTWMCNFVAGSIGLGLVFYILRR